MLEDTILSSPTAGKALTGCELHVAGPTTSSSKCPQIPLCQGRVRTPHARRTLALVRWVGAVSDPVEAADKA